MTKTTRIISIVLMAIPVLVLLMGGVMKLAGAEPAVVMQFLTRVGFGGYIKVLGSMELAIAALIIYPLTNKIGFLLASCYFGGAFCLEISGGQPPASTIFLGMLWVSMYLRDRSMFLGKA
jgi:hypothetical protein